MFKVMLLQALLLAGLLLGVPNLPMVSGYHFVALAQTLPSSQTSGQTVGISSATAESMTGYTSLDYNNIPTEKISQFVNAYLKVVELIERREGELQSSETESESAQLEQEIETEAFTLIEQAGLTRQEYLQLLSLANTEPEFGERIADQLQEATQ